MLAGGLRIKADQVQWEFHSLIRTSPHAENHRIGKGPTDKCCTVLPIILHRPELNFDHAVSEIKCGHKMRAVPSKNETLDLRQRHHCTLNALTAIAFGPRPVGKIVNSDRVPARTTAISPDRLSTTKIRNPLPENAIATGPSPT